MLSPAQNLFGGGSASGKYILLRLRACLRCTRALLLKLEDTTLLAARAKLRGKSIHMMLPDSARASRHGPFIDVSIQHRVLGIETGALVLRATEREASLHRIELDHNFPLLDPLSTEDPHAADEGPIKGVKLNSGLVARYISRSYNNNIEL